MKNVYFLSDAHLGSRAIEHGRTQERRLVNFLDSIKHKASAVYLLGDMFDFWYEFRLVVCLLFATLAENLRMNSSNSFFFSSAFCFWFCACLKANCEDSYQKE